MLEADSLQGTAASLIMKHVCTKLAQADSLFQINKYFIRLKHLLVILQQNLPRGRTNK